MNLSHHICETWRAKLKLARKHKQEHFQQFADEAMQFYDGTHDFMYESGYAGSGLVVNGDENFPKPLFGMTANKVSELVQLFLPVLYHRNPVRQVNPRKVNVPPELLARFGVMPNDQLESIDALRAKLMEFYLNFTPNELSLQENFRKCVVEALVKGRGIVWTLLHPGPKGMMVGSFYDSVDHLLVDPDCEDLMQAQWVARERFGPAWKLERSWGLPTGTLKPSHESLNQRADQSTNLMVEYDRSAERTYDQVRYWEIFSRMGVGGRLAGFDQTARELLAEFERDDNLGFDGDHVYLVIAEGYEAPLNLPPGIEQQPDPIAEMKARLSWPTPFYNEQTDPWPFTELDFHTIPKKSWPQSHIKPAMGYQKFLNWAYSFLMCKMRTASRDLLAHAADLDEFANKLMELGDYGLIPVDVEHFSGGKKITDMISWIQAPPMNGDFWTVIAAVNQEFEKATGMGELMYGQTAHQYRSATEADVKQSNMNVRPDYMAERVESAATRIARKEGQAARYHLAANDVAPCFGETFDPMTGIASGPFTQAWMTLVRQPDMDANAAELEYRIEAGSARKPNKQRDIANIDESASFILPAFMQFYQATGDPTQLNAWTHEWARTRDMNPALVAFPDMRMQMQAQAQAQAAAQQQPQQQQQPAQRVA